MSKPPPAAKQEGGRRMRCISAKVFDIDLTKGSIQEKQLPEEYWQLHLGGSGVAARLLYDEGTYAVDPLGPENILVFMNGLFTGTPVPCGCKMAVCAKSPLTGIWGEATVGGYFGAELRKTGYEGFLVRGKAQRPSYLLIENGQVSIREAEDLWGLDTYKTSELLKDRHGEKYEVAAIGPSGEKLVLLAGIMFGGSETRAAGRTGLGAVMGSKNLKAVVIRGTNPVDLFNRSGLVQSIQETVPVIKANTKGLTDFGTAGGVMAVEANGDLSIRNWSLGSWTEGAAKTNGQKIAETVFVSHYGCFACPIRCGKNVRVPVGPFKGQLAHGPEYETTDGFGANLLNEDLDVIVAANDLCNRYGLDTISTSGVIGWAMECYENGLITKEETGGIEITWGNGEAILKLTELIGKREGFGEFLGQGVKRAAEKLGGLAVEFAVHTKGLEYAFHDPRAFTSMAANYATANRGACHLEGLTYFAEQGAFPLSLVDFEKEFTRHGHENKAEIAVIMQNFMEAMNNLGLCKFLIRGKDSTSPAIFAQWIHQVTGIPYSKADLMKAGERNFNLKRLFNGKIGITRKDDALPPRLGVHDKESGAAKGSIPYMGKILWDYYRIRGWTPEGIPGKEKLRELGL